MKYPIRAVPWFTDEATRFINNLFKWYPSFINRRVSVLEVGSGNSTLFFLNKGFRVVSLEASSEYVNYVVGIAKTLGYSVNVVDAMEQVNDCYDLCIVKLADYDNTMHPPGFWYDSLGIEDIHLDYDLLVNDGVDRKFFLNKFRSCTNSIIVLDNCEYAANWGRLMRSSAKPDLITDYRSFLRSKDWTSMLFEQPEGREGRGSGDNTGWESDVRWLTAIAWSRDHVFSDLMISNLGFPLVNEQGISDADLESLNDRCAFDWEQMKWEDENIYPETLDLGLHRSFK
jgi:hypothetical protein